MKTLKIILNQGVDVIMCFVTLGLLIWYMINPEKNFTSMLGIYVLYIIFNIINKVRIVKSKQYEF